MGAEDTVIKDTEVSATGPGGWGLKMRNVDLRTFMLILTLVAAIGAGAIGWHHEVNAQTQSKELATTLEKSQKVTAEALKEWQNSQKASNDAIVKALEKVAAQVTIGNCMNEPAMKNRQDAREVCRRIVRDDR